MILLVLLVIIMFLWNINKSYEGFVDEDVGSEIKMDSYDGGVTPLLKLGENVFYDPNNGNLIEVIDNVQTSSDSPIYKYNKEGVYSSTTETYMEDTHIATELTIITRNGTKYTGLKTTVELTIDDNTKQRVQPVIETNKHIIPTVDGNNHVEDLDVSYHSNLYNTSSDTDIKNILYVAWKQDTYITTFDSNHKIKKTFAYIDNNLITTSDNNIENLNDDVASSFSSYVALDSSHDKSLVSVNQYTNKRKVLQLSEYVFFDFKTGDLIIKQSNTNFDIFPRDKSGLLESIPSGSVQKMSIYDSANIVDVGNSIQVDCKLDFQGQQMVIYLAIGKSTIITLLRKASTEDDTLTHQKTYLLDIEGIKGNSPITLTQLINNSETSTNTNISSISSEVPEINRNESKLLKKQQSELNKIRENNLLSSKLLSTLLATRRNGGDAKEIDNDSDYMLKTQVVPPVCPACPVCPKMPSKIHCTNCGGQGGSGTLSKSGQSMVNSDGSKQRNIRGPNIINNAVNTTGELATTTIKTADNLLRDTASGTADIASTTLKTADNLLRDTASGTLDVAGNIGGGIMKLLTPQQQQQQPQPQQQQQQQPQPQQQQQQRLINVQRQQQPQGTRTQYNEQATRREVSNNFSRNGLLPEKQSTSYMPLTADFSSFGR